LNAHKELFQRICKCYNKKYIFIFYIINLKFYFLNYIYINIFIHILLLNRYPLRSEVKRENEKRLLQLKGQSKFYHSCDMGDPRLLEQIKKNCPAPEVLEIKLEAQVSLIKNLDNTLINGSLGIVKGFSEKGYPIVFFPVSKRLEIITPQEWVNELPLTKNGNTKEEAIKAKRIQVTIKIL